jgi:hypothetical protein
VIAARVLSVIRSTSGGEPSFMHLQIPLASVLVLVVSACAPPRVVDEGDATGEPGDLPDVQYVDCADLGPGEPTVGPGEPGPLGFPIHACNPRGSGEGEFKCCSTDPSTADGELPEYQGRAIVGSTPLYADAANDAGTLGMCVRTGDIPAGFGMQAAAAWNCPIPCNPTWDAGDVEAVCGQARVCCQTFELGENDCVLDGATDLWRPVTGADIGSNSSAPVTNWNAVAHDTHQDPNGTVCNAFAGGDQQSPEFLECIRHLTVADQRGYCMGLGAGQVCPATLPSYVDACEAMNG